MIEKKFLEKNACFISPIKISPEFIIVHSTGVGYKSKDTLFNSWNKPDKLSVHGMVDDVGSYHTLPLDVLGWHVGKKGNAKTVGFEICEPKFIAYADKAHTKIDTVAYDPKSTDVRFDFEKRYQNAVQLAAYFCKNLRLSADRILSHREACARGIASNHADVEHWFPLFGVTMDDFRREVKKELNRTKIYKPKNEGRIKKMTK